ncbi:MAG: ATP-binding domain-containing protein [Pseudomonadota bacterium]
MSSSLYYNNVERSAKTVPLLNAIERYSTEQNKYIFTLCSPLGEKEYNYEYSDAFVIASPGHKILFLNYGDDQEAFNEFIEDLIEDLGFISDKFRYKERIGRPKRWREHVVQAISVDLTNIDIPLIFNNSELQDRTHSQTVELIISLLTGSINDIERVGDEVPNHLLDRLKAKIQLFDGDQTRFIYQNLEKKDITIQGLSGTGKTELLLHKLKELYIEDKESKIMFTCHNKILATDLRDRIPEFFNFMKVEEQIKWQERLWCVNAWGSGKDRNSGAYSYIVHHYRIPFQGYGSTSSFELVCETALKHIDETALQEFGFAFDYMLIDESQDFPQVFLDLCIKVSRKNVYIAGDIFQGIFDTNIVSEIKPDYLLSKCYRTDPRTLMFAHAVGMGLFESPKLRWLDDTEWNVCGYQFEKSDSGPTYLLSREPLRRFEDLSAENYESIRMIQFGANQETSLSESVLNILSELIEENPTITPNDIGIIFIENNKSTYHYADQLEQLIPRHFNFEVNKAYESKTKIDNTLFISNRNNVKGLEFPFVIVVASNIQSSRSYRNALYTMISRSFLRTYFLVEQYNNLNTSKFLEAGLQEILENGTMSVVAPSVKEQEDIKTRITYKEENQSYYDFMESVFDEVEVLPIFREGLSKSLEGIIGTKFNFNKAVEIARFNYNEMLGRDE